MKKITILIALVCSLNFLFAQTAINLDIKHLLAGEDFSSTAVTSNNLGYGATFDRVEYYISQIQLVHDGGQIIELDDTYLLVDANNPETFDLGNHAITHLDSVFFYIGVDSPNNHEDPATFDANHPLAPQNPSMHWGWSAGYRFVALEGTCGLNNGFTFELHGLGDDNYARKLVKVAINKTTIENVINAEINADYIKAVEDMGLNSTVISHGESDEAKDAITNFNNLVFSKVEVATSIESALNASIAIYPNPTKGNFTVNGIEGSTFDLKIFDAGGKIVKEYIALTNSSLVTIEKKGLYFIELIHLKESKLQKLIVY